MKKLIEYQYVYIRYFRVQQEVSNEIKTSISFIKDELQISINNNTSCKIRKGIPFLILQDVLLLMEI